MPKIQGLQKETQPLSGAVSSAQPIAALRESQNGPDQPLTRKQPFGAPLPEQGGDEGGADTRSAPIETPAPLREDERYNKERHGLEAMRKLIEQSEKDLKSAKDDTYDAAQAEADSKSLYDGLPEAHKAIADHLFADNQALISDELQKKNTDRAQQGLVDEVLNLTGVLNQVLTKEALAEDGHELIEAVNEESAAILLRTSLPEPVKGAVLETITQKRMQDIARTIDPLHFQELARQKGIDVRFAEGEADQLGAGQPGEETLGEEFGGLFGRDILDVVKERFHGEIKETIDGQLKGLSERARQTRIERLETLLETDPENETFLTSLQVAQENLAAQSKALGKDPFRFAAMEEVIELSPLLNEADLKAGFEKRGSDAKTIAQTYERPLRFFRPGEVTGFVSRLRELPWNEQLETMDVFAETLGETLGDEAGGVFAEINEGYPLFGAVAQLQTENPDRAAKILSGLSESRQKDNTQLTANIETAISAVLAPVAGGQPKELLESGQPKEHLGEPDAETQEKSRLTRGLNLDSAVANADAVSASEAQRNQPEAQQENMVDAPVVDGQPKAHLESEQPEGPLKMSSEAQKSQVDELLETLASLELEEGEGKISDISGEGLQGLSGLIQKNPTFKNLSEAQQEEISEQITELRGAGLSNEDVQEVLSAAETEFLKRSQVAGASAEGSRKSFNIKNIFETAQKDRGVDKRSPRVGRGGRVGLAIEIGREVLKELVPIPPAGDVREKEFEAPDGRTTKVRVDGPAGLAELTIDGADESHTKVILRGNAQRGFTLDGGTRFEDGERRELTRQELDEFLSANTKAMAEAGVTILPSEGNEDDATDEQNGDNAGAVGGAHGAPEEPQPDDKKTGKKARDSSKAEKHGGGDKELEKVQDQVDKLRESKKGATKKQRKAIQNKIDKILENAAKRRRGTLHTRTKQ